MHTKGATLGSATNWLVNFMVVEITPIGIQNLRWRLYIIWIVVNAVMVPAARRTLEDMDEYYHTKPPLLVVRDKEAIFSKHPEKYRIRDPKSILEVLPALTLWGLNNRGRNGVGAKLEPKIDEAATVYTLRMWQLDDYITKREEYTVAVDGNCHIDGSERNLLKFRGRLLVFFGQGT